MGQVTQTVTVFSLRSMHAIIAIIPPAIIAINPRTISRRNCSHRDRVFHRRSINGRRDLQA
jgi:hypothetical protein